MFWYGKPSTKRSVKFVGIIVVCGLILGLYFEWRRPTTSVISKIEIGMQRAQVRLILGYPSFSYPCSDESQSDDWEVADGWIIVDYDELGFVTEKRAIRGNRLKIWFWRIWHGLPSWSVSNGGELL